ncbi:MAG: GNAT family N-acetyltransferase, partial [Deltaproteobacteria bacterium]|nr:GNAT family N-acetyltransferase [Deltaproteobacteria bacterium]
MPEESFSLEICRRIPEHARRIMEWRNDPQTLAMSYHREPKAWERFWPEYQREYLCYPDLPPLFALDQGRRVAFIRYRPVPHPLPSRRRCCDVSINVAPELRRLGLGGPALAVANEFIRSLGWDDQLAEVREENTASGKFFLKAGYRELDRIVHVVPETQEHVAVRRFMLNLNAQLALEKDGVLVVAEAGSNWRMGAPKRDLDMARALIEVAAEAGADVVKFQTFRPDTVYVANAGNSDYLAQEGIKDSIRDIFTDLSMPYEMIPKLAEHCAKCNIRFMSTPFSLDDFNAVDPYVSIHKIASYEVSHTRLLEAAGRSGKPLVLSTG